MYQLLISIIIVILGILSPNGGFELKEFNGVVKNLKGEPLKAKVEYYNLGTHDHIGSLNSKPQSGEFTVKFKNNVSYSIFISAHGYFSSYMIVDIHDSIDLHEFKLIPIEENIVFPLNHLLFDEGDHLINEESFAELDNLIGFLRINPETVIQLEGHTDYLGSKNQNQDLASRRIHEVKNYITAQGIKKKRIHTKSYGGSKPLVVSSKIEERKANRRVEVRIIQIK